MKWGNVKISKIFYHSWVRWYHDGTIHAETNA